MKELTQFTVGDTVATAIDLTQPMIFFSRPKGEYAGDDTKRVILDFYIANAIISEGGNYVKVKIDSDRFDVKEWMPYLIEGLTEGKHKIVITLVDKSGKRIPGPYSSANQTITISPLK